MRRTTNLFRSPLYWIAAEGGEIEFREVFDLPSGYDVEHGVVTMSGDNP